MQVTIKLPDNFYNLPKEQKKEIALQAVETKQNDITQDWQQQWKSALLSGSSFAYARKSSANQEIGVPDVILACTEIQCQSGDWRSRCYSCVADMTTSLTFKSVENEPLTLIEI